MRFLCLCVCVAASVQLVAPAPANGFVFPENRQEKKLEPIITPPKLPFLEHLDRDPSTLLPNETGPGFRHGGSRNPKQVPTRPRFGLGGGFSVAPSNGGLTASISSSASGAGASHSASQSFSFGFNQGFGASQSASQSSSFSNAFGGGFSGSQASSQAASFSGNSAAAAASSSAAFAGSGNAASQSASSAFGFNSLNGFQNTPPEDPVIDIRHRGGHQAAGAFVFPGQSGSRHIGAAASRVRTNRPSNNRGGEDEWLAILVSD